MLEIITTSYNVLYNLLALHTTILKTSNTSTTSTSPSMETSAVPPGPWRCAGGPLSDSILNLLSLGFDFVHYYIRSWGLRVQTHLSNGHNHSSTLVRGERVSGNHTHSAPHSPTDAPHPAPIVAGRSFSAVFNFPTFQKGVSTCVQPPPAD